MLLIPDDMQIVQIDFFYRQLGHLLQTAVRYPLVELDQFAVKIALLKIVFVFQVDWITIKNILSFVKWLVDLACDKVIKAQAAARVTAVLQALRLVVKVGSIRVGEGKAILTGNRFDIASCDFLKAFQHNKTPLKIISTIILNG